MEVTVHAFTNKVDHRADILLSDVYIAPALNLLEGEKFKPIKYVALWDTGATNSVVTHRVAQKCGLKPTGVVEVQLAGAKDLRNTYLVALGLPNRVMFPQVRVTDADEIGGADVLIGMDIIGQGDFAVTHGDGKTTLSFRVPSVENIDFTDSHRLPKGAKETRKPASKTSKSTPKKTKSPEKKREDKRKKKRKK